MANATLRERNDIPLNFPAHLLTPQYLCLCTILGLSRHYVETKCGGGENRLSGVSSETVETEK
ncbi:hypothetical protein [Nodularia spumigena]|uniref:hypothetical protein n=1 Tax=Nodularia spumigena TaxID=70799 RepID=UPI002B204C04|nr:hypothetical protein [Nodularia spumigena]MEA5526455.1 hypothetical protein [Nodularia spumigena UHCC 0143]